MLIKTRIAVLGVVGALGLAAPAWAATPPFKQCPPVGLDTSCQVLITIGGSGSTIQSDPSQGPYESQDDVLVGVVNSSSGPLKSITLTASGAFGFDGDGICQPTGWPGTLRTPTPAGCPPPFNGPTGYTPNGYEGPATWFSPVSSADSGTVNFNPALPAGASTYFSLEAPPTGQSIRFSTTLTTAMTANGATASNLTEAVGTAVTDKATLQGTNAASATGTVTYTAYSDRACTMVAGGGGTMNVSAGAVPASNPLTLPVGTYYLQASYSGDSQNAPSQSVCGSEVLNIHVQSVTPPCTVRLTGGGIFEPTQAVWQDDPFYINKRINYLTPGPGSGTATAALAMVQGRPTVLFGPLKPGTNERNILITGTTTYTRPASVSLRFKLHQGAAETDLFTAPPNEQSTRLAETVQPFPGSAPSQVRQINFAGPCGTAQPFTLVLHVVKGIGDRNAAPFSFSAAGPYTITVVPVVGGQELSDVFGTVTGRVVRTFPANLNFVPATLAGAVSRDDKAKLVRETTSLKSEVETHFPDYLPIGAAAAGATQPTHLDNFADLSKGPPQRDAAFRQQARQIGVPALAIKLETKLEELVNDLSDATIVGGYSRTIVVVSKNDLANQPDFRYEDPNGEFTAVAKGVTASQKVIFMAAGANHYSVAHELAHSLDYLWSNDQANNKLVRDCRVDLHNAHPDPKAANGFQIHDGASLVRVRRANQDSLMGRAGKASDIWVDQCTYKHFLDTLQAQAPDPNVILVNGLLARHRGRYAEQLLLAKRLAAPLDLPSGRGRWTIVLRSSSGQELARYHFDPNWSVSEGGKFQKSIVSFQYALPAPAGAKVIQLVAPSSATRAIRALDTG